MLSCMPMYAVNLHFHSSNVASFPSYVGGFSFSLCVEARSSVASSFAATGVPMLWPGIKDKIVAIDMKRTAARHNQDMLDDDRYSQLY